MHRPYGVKVPGGRLFVLGDHRVDSVDSRFIATDGHRGTVAVGDVKGRVVGGPGRLGGPAAVRAARTGPGRHGARLGNRRRGGAQEAGRPARTAVALPRVRVSGRRSGPGPRASPRGPGPWPPRPRCRCPAPGR
ncbi:S26 family signal peptidase [Streptomyces sp. NPDC003480]